MLTGGMGAGGQPPTIDPSGFLEGVHKGGGDDLGAHRLRLALQAVAKAVKGGTYHTPRKLAHAAAHLVKQPGFRAAHAVFDHDGLGLGHRGRGVWIPGGHVAGVQVSRHCCKAAPMLVPVPKGYGLCFGQFTGL